MTRPLVSQILQTSWPPASNMCVVWLCGEYTFPAPSETFRVHESHSTPSARRGWRRSPRGPRPVYNNLRLSPSSLLLGTSTPSFAAFATTKESSPHFSVAPWVFDASFLPGAGFRSRLSSFLTFVLCCLSFQSSAASCFATEPMRRKPGKSSTGTGVPSALSHGSTTAPTATRFATASLMLIGPLDQAKVLKWNEATRRRYFFCSDCFFSPFPGHCESRSTNFEVSTAGISVRVCPGGSVTFFFFLR
mmetsp:Transcript_24246/g.68093  ORF Transcript_24246/g.68093 Transcript_24246/m.68093 type:complete len:247 (-) Transcript_24246:186-926(-)